RRSRWGSTRPIPTRAAVSFGARSSTPGSKRDLLGGRSQGASGLPVFMQRHIGREESGSAFALASGQRRNVLKPRWLRPSLRIGRAVLLRLTPTDQGNAMKLRPTLCAAAVFAAQPAWAQGSAADVTDMQALRAAVKTDKKAFVASAMQLTEAEA